MKGNYSIPTEKRGLLGRYKDQLRIVANPTKSIKAKRKVLVQKGGFLPIVLATLGGLLSALLQ